MLTTTLRVHDLRSSYDKRQIVRGVTLSVRQGETLAIIGPNGAGKSTLLKAIAGLASIDDGEIFLRDQDISTLLPHERTRRGLGYLMQGGRAFSSLSVGENLAIGAQTQPRSRRQRVVTEIAEVFQLTGELRKSVGVLSGGQRQRVGMAVVLVGHPSALLLDEPSAGLAPVVVKGIFQALREYQTRHSAAVLLVEQQLSAAIDFADRI